MYSLCRTENPALHSCRLASGLFCVGRFKKVTHLFPQSPVTGRRGSQVLVDRQLVVGDWNCWHLCACLTPSSLNTLPSLSCSVSPSGECITLGFSATLEGGRRGRSGFFFFYYNDFYFFHYSWFTCVPPALAPCPTQGYGSPTVLASLGSAYTVLLLILSFPGLI